MSKFISKQSVASWYALSALLATFLVGQVILWFFPDRSSMGASLLFILMNLIPMITAAVFSLVLSEVNSLGDFFKKVFLQKESSLSWILAFFIPVIYYGISTLLMNVRFTGNSLLAFFLYFPWTFLYGGLEEVGWRWFLQDHLSFSKHFIPKMMVLSIVWFLLAYPYLSTPLDYSRFAQLSHLLPDDFREYLPIWSAQGVLERSYSLYPRSYAD